MSLRLKKHPDSLISSSVGKEKTNFNEITDSDFQKFISMNKVTAEKLELIAAKIISNKTLSKYELAIYSEKSKEIKNIIMSEFIKK
ncbi:MAG: hypothetical protein IT267_07160 [Saprospiraceae bacterium]|nr:hypothetical protein [Saprospiraceae bacterium]